MYILIHIHVEPTTPDDTEDVAELGGWAVEVALLGDTELDPCETPAVGK